jgi:diguanylate cyclase (GGDEF)-like protein
VIDHVKNWINRQLSLGEFTSRRSVVVRAGVMAVRIAVLAYTMNVIAHFGLYWAGLLPYDLFPALVLATCLTPPVSLIVAFAAYYVVGMAVFELHVQRSEFERLSRTDSLTGLNNRHAFLQAFDQSPEAATLVLFDIDRFKQVNDGHGHAAGDEVIMMMAEELRQTFAEHFVARLGGEEFVVLIRGLAREACMALVEDARQSIASRRVRSGEGDVAVTVSAGVADRYGGEEFRSLFAAADKALYLAKAAGRNRAVHAQDLGSVFPPSAKAGAQQIAS